MKRFSVTGVARDKEYDLTQGKAGSRVVYFTANPNGEAETIRVALKPALHLKRAELLYDMSRLMVKSRSARGNLLTKYEVKSVTLKQRGHSTLGGRKVWFDPDVLRLNYDGQGTYLGEFKDDDRVLVITHTGNYYLTTFELTAHCDNDIRVIERFDADKVWSLVFWNAELGYYYAKRFALDAQLKAQNFLSDGQDSRIVLLTDHPQPVVKVLYEDTWREAATIELTEFFSPKSPKAKGKRLTTLAVTTIEDVSPEIAEETPEDIVEEATEEAVETKHEEPAVEPTTETAIEPLVPLTIQSDFPEDSKPVDTPPSPKQDEDNQLSLF